MASDTPSHSGETTTVQYWRGITKAINKFTKTQQKKLLFKIYWSNHSHLTKYYGFKFHNMVILKIGLFIIIIIL